MLSQEQAGVYPSEPARPTNQIGLAIFDIPLGQSDNDLGKPPLAGIRWVIMEIEAIQVQWGQCGRGAVCAMPSGTLVQT